MTADTAAIHIEADAQTVFAYVTDPHKLNRWSFGTWETSIRSDGLVKGQSLATGATAFLRMDMDRDRLLVDYLLGGTADVLIPRISARVIPAEVTGHASGTSTLLFTALRLTDMDDYRWDSMCRLHRVELDVIKGQIESGHNPRA